MKEFLERLLRRKRKAQRAAEQSKEPVTLVATIDGKVIFQGEISC